MLVSWCLLWWIDRRGGFRGCQWDWWWGALLTHRKITWNELRRLVAVVGIWDDSSLELDSMVKGREIKRSLEPTINGGGTIITSRGFDLRSQLALDPVGLNSELWSGKDSAMICGRTFNSRDCSGGTFVGVFELMLVFQQGNQQLMSTMYLPQKGFKFT